MDITFSCEKCGQSMAIDEAGAGITVDCPNCGKPVYVPCRQPPSARNDPVRIEASSAKPVSIATAITPAPQRLVSDTILLHGTGGAAFSLHFIEHPTRFYSDLQDCLAKVK